MKMLCYRMEPNPPPLRPGRPDRAWMDAFQNRHPYRCLPLVIANSTGWEIVSPYSFTMSWNGGLQASDIRIESDDGDAGVHRLVTSHFTHGVVTFHTGYLFRTEPGWNLMAGGPPNWPKDGFYPLTGLVETDWLPFPFTMNWRFTRPGFVSFEAGEPFCFITPVPHSAIDAVQPLALSIDEDPALKAEYLGWRDSRNDFLEKLEARDKETVEQGWQRHYFKGEKQSGAAAPIAHVSRRRLRPLIDIEDSEEMVVVGRAAPDADPEQAGSSQAGLGPEGDKSE